MYIKLANFLNIPSDVLHNHFSLYMIGHENIRIECIKKIVFYELDCIKVECFYMNIMINGEGLVIDWINEHEIQIRGKIGQICFEPCHQED